LSVCVHRLFDWRSSELVVEGQTTFQPFVVYVQAANDEGDAPICRLVVVAVVEWRSDQLS